MLRYIYGHDLHRFPQLRRSMFHDRAEQFKHRLGWAVRVNAAGEERDEYDEINPLYVIWELPDGSHGGSMRFLPTTGRTMVNDHFSHLCDGVKIQSPLIWECTRFCISPRADRRAAAALTLGAGEIMARFHLRHFIGVFDPRMERIYRRMGLNPDVIGRSGEGADEIGVGLWEMDAAAWPRVLAKVGVTRQISTQWFDRALGSAQREALRVTA